ncbi:MAG: hypothetical protein JST35_04125 [Armatimonadetes bacterium]|nr:hypothetical protein [Armatimonadota bacterium]
MTLLTAFILLGSGPTKPKPIEVTVTATAEAKKVLAVSYQKFLSMKSLTYDYDIDEKGTAWFTPSAARQVSPAGEWVYRNGILTIRTSKGAFQGRIQLGRVPAFASRAGMRVETQLLHLLGARVPINELIARNSKVRVTGNVVLGKQRAQILEIDSSKNLLSVALRSSDGMILTSHTTIKGADGARIPGATARYTSVQLNGAWSPKAWPLPKGPYQPISKLMK